MAIMYRNMLKRELSNEINKKRRYREHLLLSLYMITLNPITQIVSKRLRTSPSFRLHASDPTTALSPHHHPFYNSLHPILLTHSIPAASPCPRFLSFLDRYVSTGVGALSFVWFGNVTAVSFATLTSWIDKLVQIVLSR